ncbi:MAG: ABC transporter permease [Deltaproteobacteria bacterium]
MSTILSISALTLRDLLRRRILAVLVLFMGAMVLLSFPLRELTIGQWYRLIVDVGLAANDLTVTLIAILVGSSLVAGDLERRTLFPILSRPIPRSAFVFGRFIGLSCALASLAVVMSLGTALLLVMSRQPHLEPLAQATIGIVVNGWLVAGFAFLFSCFTSATLAGTFTLSLTLIGHFTDSLAFFAAKSSSAPARVTMIALAKVLPNLSILNFKTLASHGHLLAWQSVAPRVAYGVVYAIASVSLGAFLFTWRDLK